MLFGVLFFVKTVKIGNAAPDPHVGLLFTAHPVEPGKVVRPSTSIATGAFPLIPPPANGREGCGKEALLGLSELLLPCANSSVSSKRASNDFEAQGRLVLADLLETKTSPVN